jgi:thiamine biosynthesis lipoprotein
MHYNRKKHFLIFLLSVLLLLISGCNKQSVKYSNTDFAMGTTISEIIYGNDQESCEKADQDIIGILKQIENEQISWRVEGSQIYQINHTDKPVSVDSEVLSWLKESVGIAKDTNGALNPGVGTLAQLWDIGGDNPRVPSNQEIKKALEQIDYQDIIIEESRVDTDPEEVQVDLGAVGKGIGADKAAQYLESNDSITGAVISVGGSLCVYGNKNDGSVWTIGIQDPRGETGEMLGAVTADKDCFISTSGDYEKNIEQDGKRYHHILDSKTGYPSDSGLISVTIMCDSGIDSDGLSTACFVLGMEKSRELLDKYNAEAIFVDSDKNVYVTDGINFELKNTKEYSYKDF